MAVRHILLLGNPKLYTPCESVSQDECEALSTVVTDLHDSMLDFRRTYGAGRAIAAPQIGVGKRLVYMHIDRPVVLLNPRVEPVGKTVFETWDDCMSFPEILVKVIRYQHCLIHYRDLAWQEQTLDVEDNLAELLQHEIDHLDGILAVSKAIDAHSFALRSQREYTAYERSELQGL